MTTGPIEHIDTASRQRDDFRRVVSQALAQGPLGAALSASARLQAADAAFDALPDLVEALRRGPALPPVMTSAIREVLGWPSFRCAPAAHLFRDAGAEIQRKAEDEQAHVLFWLLHLAIEHGANWPDAAQRDIEAAAERVKAASTNHAGA